MNISNNILTMNKFNTLQHCYPLDRFGRGQCIYTMAFPRSCTTSFNLSDLTESKYLFKHNLQRKIVHIIISDSNGNTIIPNNIFYKDYNTVIITLPEYVTRPFPGPWTVIASSQSECEKCVFHYTRFQKIMKQIYKKIR